MTDYFYRPTCGEGHENRPTKSGVPLSKVTLLQLLSLEDSQVASLIIDKLEALGFDQQGTPENLIFGCTSNDGEFHPLMTLDEAGACIVLLPKDSELLGGNEIHNLRFSANIFAPFFKKEQMTRPESPGYTGQYCWLKREPVQFAEYIDEYRIKLMKKLEHRE
ncbi:hypothetical protein [Georgfuchsia toluolica]|uniref:hypothetical protein n=1 Tax=Georgfuchsia toluolica TaxID=424218 RepID=UPI001C72B5FB|nr:hypothetical protein [Georgfuchsia toluolica]